jgi:pseudaminic acid synthase
MIKIGNAQIGKNEKPFIIAEMSGNHNQSLDRALAIVDAAARTGAHGLKIQTYTPDTMTLDLDEREFHVSDNSSLWAGASLYNLYREAQTPWEWHQAIFDRARAHGMIGFSTPFDETSVEFLESLDVPCYKIASFENTDIQLIRRVAATGKPLIISTGMATVAELDESVRAAREAGCKDLVLLKCTSTYPATAENTNISTIPHMRELFGCEVGLSDHTMGSGVAVASVALGATVIEKHFTLSRADGGVDSAFSVEPQELSDLVVATERASLYITADVAVGEIFTRDNVRAIRPGLGLPTKYLDMILGKRAKRDLARGTALLWDALE